MGYVRISDKPYKIDAKAMEISEIANAEKKIPNSFIKESGNDVTDELVDYIYPLIQGESDVIYKNGLPVHLIR